MRRAPLGLLFLFPVLLAGVLAAPAQGRPPTSVRPWKGLLPDPEQDSAGKEREDDAWLAIRVLDARTREPIPGARWIRTPEWIAPWRLHHDQVLDTATTDAEGFAYLPRNKARWPHDCHWLVRAPGYAPHHDYTTRPQPEVALEPGVVVRGRVLDPLGRGVPDARVAYLGGCSHGTAAARCVADDTGRFALGPVPRSYPGQLWVEGAGIASALLALSSPDSLGREGIELVMGPGERFEGRIVGLLGRPLAGAVVRAFNEQRGPSAMCDAHGRFVIEGVAPRSMLRVYGPADLLEDDGGRLVEGAHPDVPLHLVVSPLGVRVADDDARVRVRARRADGSPAPDLAYRLVALPGGCGPSGVTDTEANGDAGEVGAALERVPAGRYRVVPDDPFGREGFDPVEVRATPGGEALAQLHVRVQPRLAIHGEVPPKARLLLAVPRADPVEAWDEPRWAPSLPAQGPAVLRVACKGRRPFFFPVGAIEDGRRGVTVALPLPRRIRLPEGARHVRVRAEGRRVVGYRDGPAWVTDATGPVRLSWKDALGTAWRATARLPDEPGADVAPGPGSVHRAPARVRVAALDPAETDVAAGAWREVEPGAWVTFERKGHCILRGRAPRRGERVLRWGPSSLRLRVSVGPRAADALVMLAGEVYRVPQGVLELRGLPAGRLDAVVCLRDDPDSGVACELHLADHGPNPCAIDLDAR